MGFLILATDIKPWMRSAIPAPACMTISSMSPIFKGAEALKRSCNKHWAVWYSICAYPHALTWGDARDDIDTTTKNNHMNYSHLQ